VLRLGQGLENESDYSEYSFVFPLRDSQAFVALVNEWGNTGRLIPLQTQQEGVFLALVLETSKTSLITAGRPGTDNAHLAGYLALLLFVAAPLRRSGAYTVPDFAEARLSSPTLRRLCTLFVLIIGWLYLLPQLQIFSVFAMTINGQTAHYDVGASGVAQPILARKADNTVFTGKSLYGLQLGVDYAPRFRQAQANLHGNVRAHAAPGRAAGAAGHAGGGGEHTKCADEIAALANALARKAHRLLVIASDELGVGGDTAMCRGKGIAGTQPQGVTRGQITFFPTPAIGQGDAIQPAGR